MEDWNLDETRSLVDKLYGRDQLALAAPCLRSVDDRLRYSAIHYQDALDAMEKFTGEHLQESSLIEVMFMAVSQPKPWTEFNLAIRRIAAHLVACFQSVHSLADTLAHAAFFSLALDKDTDALRPRQVTASKVIGRIARYEDAASVGMALQDLTTGGQFAYLDALVNHCKHRSIVFPTMNEDLTGERAERHQLRMEGFKYEGTPYPPVEVNSFIVNEFERCGRCALQAGKELNLTLRSRLERRAQP